jgi:cell division protein FtsX
MDINLADVTLHIDENLSAEQRGTVEESLRALDGVVSIHNSDKTPHLIVIEYNPAVMDSQRILKRVTDQNAHAKLVGL